MIYAYIGITVLWLFLFCYVIIASIDFGAGFFALHSKITGNDKKTNHLISRYLNPVWEVTNVFFVFFFVGFVGFFPESVKYLGTVLLVPGSIALIMISLRNSFYAFENYGQDTKLSWMVMYGVTGLLIPASLATALTITEGGYISENHGHVDLEWLQLILSPFAWSVVFLAIISVLYISSGFLTFYAHKAEDKPAYELTRMWHIFWGLPMIIISLFVFLSLRIQNSEHFYTAIFDYWWMFVLSFIFFCIALLLTILKRNHGLAFILIILQMLMAFFGYGMSKLPYLLYPFVKITDAHVNPEMGWALVIAFILGLLLLVPSLILLLRLFVFDKDYVEGKK
ncbi:cytochrome d ubiquinol oxidase subunit II [Staphylococcus simiae]|uniref:cytochrome d ubiquinol oxidase subunit II n=1 Tax=Staphylococcus simiae TaxID=308354 RepID=UPI001A96BD7C|nr:cytochrome d ubiquinol oxidase subunit II [Staphylococcus simiae]MBO1198911.1 cytochrome d ubiquinol oxidase subunit II [Staphylococcus simiae]MBO1201108.1 cytochrome d ubiquinol oxidase subunit II [Staphylococcus simiae]MBO1204110.1 cytochrome d ubiquinol oxidase subunit II [Staphylococcus simiae]MBO1210837.1 cytochrome d ubiquinol oxidase subunit II [Staphylococcus simiae]MBO1229498.1 cytochrome d ubiquinol oxidase subunit II [Staphylococcus simiae]